MTMAGHLSRITLVATCCGSSLRITCSNRMLKGRSPLRPPKRVLQTERSEGSQTARPVLSVVEGLFAALLMNKAVRLRSTRRAGQRSFGVRQPRWRFRCPPAAELDGEDARRSWARPKAGLRPAVQKARAHMLDMSHRFFSRLAERAALWGTQNDKRTVGGALPTLLILSDSRP